MRVIRHHNLQDTKRNTAVIDRARSSRLIRRRTTTTQPPDCAHDIARLHWTELMTGNSANRRNLAPYFR
jgi:hypothetical protein